MADRRLKTFSLLEDEESDDINVLVEKLGKKEASQDTGVEKINVKKQLNSEPEKEKPLAEIEKTSENHLIEDINGGDQGWKSGSGRLRKGRSSIGKSKLDSTENSDQDHECDSHEVEESSISLISSENGEEDQLAEENGDVEVEEKAIENSSKTGGKRRGKRNKSKSKKLLQNEGVFARVVKLAAGGLCFLVFALFFIAIAMS